MNFFASADRARQWLSARPDVAGVILGQGPALRVGVAIFGHLLDA
jgi:hypothetical protein